MCGFKFAEILKMNQALCHTLGKLFICLRWNIYNAMDNPALQFFIYFERTHRSGFNVRRKLFTSYIYREIRWTLFPRNLENVQGALLFYYYSRWEQQILGQSPDFFLKNMCRSYYLWKFKCILHCYFPWHYIKHTTPPTDYHHSLKFLMCVLICLCVLIKFLLKCSVSCIAFVLSI